MDSHAAIGSDAELITRCIALAFATDPVWEPALRRADGRTDHHEAFWRIHVEAALRHGTVRMTEGGEAVSVWLPPGADELSAEDERALDELLDGALDAEGRDALAILNERFAASHAEVSPNHYYLSLLATHPDHRGKGVGQALLAADLRLWDAEGVPAYLESTNPANDHRYARAGFRVVGGFRAVVDDAWISTMWRDVGG